MDSRQPTLKDEVLDYVLAPEDWLLQVEVPKPGNVYKHVCLDHWPVSAVLHRPTMRSTSEWAPCPKWEGSNLRGWKPAGEAA
eukprot:2077034-Prorocentrum_lima.AAC.1